jgi:SAM-dependent methyltransferase
MERTKTKKFDTSWQKVADWYKDVPKKQDGYHNSVIIPNVLSKLKQFIKPRGRVLDLACGEGTITDKIREAGYKPAGADLSSKLISEAKKIYPEIPFFVEDARKFSGGFLKLIGKVDAVVCVLALQNIDELDEVFEEVSKVLEKDGVFVFILNHPYFRTPKVTSWGFDGLVKQYRIVEKYLSELKLPIVAHPGEKDSEVSYSFHRPLQKYVKSLNKNGFCVTDIDELISNKESEPGKRAEAENDARKEIPLFMTVTARYIGE